MTDWKAPSDLRQKSYPPDMPQPKDHEERMRVARRYAQWHLGSPSWAGDIIAAYLYPERTAEMLKQEMEL